MIFSQFIRDELATAANIKSRANRSSVTDALGKIRSRLDESKRSETGTLFLASPDECHVLFPVHPIISVWYRCGVKFEVDHLSHLFQQAVIDGVYVEIYGDRCTLFSVSLESKQVTRIDSIDARIAKRQKKGGQSQNRIQRLRDETEQAFLSIAAEAIFRACYSTCSVGQTLPFWVGGPSVKKELLVPHLHAWLKPRLIDVITTTERGLSDGEILSRCVPPIKDWSAQADELLSIGLELATYGDLLDADLENGLVEALYVAPEQIREVEGREREAGRATRVRGWRGAAVFGRLGQLYVRRGGE